MAKGMTSAGSAEMRFHYRCHNGHNVVSTDPDLDICDAVLPWSPDGPLPDSKACGAELELPMVYWHDLPEQVRAAWRRSA